MKETKLTRDFPSNSDKSKVQKEAPKEGHVPPEIPKCQPIARGAKTEKSFLSKFLGEGAKDVGGFILNDILIPAAKSTLYEIITGGASMSLWGNDGKVIILLIETGDGLMSGMTTITTKAMTDGKVEK